MDSRARKDEISVRNPLTGRRLEERNVRFVLLSVREEENESVYKIVDLG